MRPWMIILTLILSMHSAAQSPLQYKNGQIYIEIIDSTSSIAPGAFNQVKYIKFDTLPPASLNVLEADREAGRITGVFNYFLKVDRKKIR